MNIARILENHARRRPDHPAIVARDRHVDYLSFYELVQGTAAQLVHSGVRRHAVVGVCLKDTIEHLVALYALAHLGAVAFPMDWRWTAQEKDRLIAFFDPHLVLTEADSPHLSAPTMPIYEAWHSGVGAPDASPPQPPEADDPLVVALSSGTTGVPKGPLLHHSHMFARFLIYYVTLGFNENDRYLCATPLYFGGSRGNAMCTLYAGGTVILFPLPYDASELVETTQRHRATRLFLVPTLLRRLLRLPDSDRPLLDRLSLLFSTGAALHPEERAEVQRRLCPRYLNFYGSTDGGGATALRPEDQGAVASSVGRPVFGAWVEVVDGEHQPLPPGEVGRVRYRNAGTVTEYYKNPSATAQAFHAGWYYPGDLGWTDKDGYLYLAGRETDLIIRGGANIYPAEIEEILLAHPAVSDAAIVGWPSREYGEEVAAFVVSEQPLEETDIIMYCRKLLAPYKVPKGVFFVHELPRSAAGKVLKAELASQLQERD